MPDSKFGDTIEALAQVIASRRVSCTERSYTARLLTGGEDQLLKKIGEEATEVVMAAKDGDTDQLTYEAADLVYHLLVVMERWGVTLDDLADELISRGG